MNYANELEAVNERMEELESLLEATTTEEEFDDVFGEYEGLTECSSELMFLVHSELEAATKKMEELNSLLDAATETRITKAEAVGILEVQPVYARLNDGSEVQVGAIAFTTWVSVSPCRYVPGQYTQHQVDDARYFFTKN